MSLVWLGLALLLLRWSAVPAMWRAVGAVYLAALAGLDLPDLDFWLPFSHRSALTHSALPAVALAMIAWARPAAAGLAIGIGLHLSADTFPDAMVGYATVKMPLFGSIGAGASYAWLAGNAALCILGGAASLRAAIGSETVVRVLAAVLVATGFLYLLSVDNGWIALLGYTGLGLVGYRAARAGVLRPRLGVFSR